MPKNKRNNNTGNKKKSQNKYCIDWIYESASSYRGFYKERGSEKNDSNWKETSEPYAHILVFGKYISYCSQKGLS